MSNVVCVGAVTIDQVYEVRSLPQNFKVKKTEDIFIGGRAVTVTLGLAQQGVDVGLIGAVGKDFGVYAQLFKDRGVDLNGLIFNEKVCDHIYAYVQKKSRETKVFYQGSGLSFGKITKLHREMIKGSDLVYVSCWDLDFAKQVLDVASDLSIPVIHNMSIETCFDKDYVTSALSHSYGIVMNVKEYEQLLTHDLGDVYAWLSRYPLLNWVVITDGEKGSDGFTKTITAHVPVEPVCVENVMGAGDAYASGLCWGYLQDWDLKKSMTWGSHLGALAVQSKSGYISVDIVKKSRS